MTLTICCLTAANILYVICYLVRDVLLLRILAVAAMFVILPYYLIPHPGRPMYEAVVWNFVFIAINLFWIILIFRERQPPTLSDDEKKLYEMTFKPACSERDMLRLLKPAHWKEVGPGETLIVGDTSPECLMLLFSGKAVVQLDGDELAKLRAGDLAGEMSFLTGNKSVADVVAEGPTRYICWPRRELEELFAKRAELKTAIYHLIGHDLVTKLSSSQESIPELTVSLKSWNSGIQDSIVNREQ